MRKSLLLSTSLLLLPTVAGASVLWKGDFESGNTSQWTKEEQVNSNRLQVQAGRVREGRYALRAAVEQGDAPIRASGNRNELVYVGPEYDGKVAEGAERVYSWSTLFDERYPSVKTWQVFTQWHHTGLTGSPPLEFYVVGEEMRMRVGGAEGVELWKAPLNRGQWNDFVLRVRWSAKPSEGLVELYVNGQQVVAPVQVSTLYKGQGVYLKQGLYRNAAIRSEGVVFHDGFTVATELADVLQPAVAAAPPAPSPDMGPAPVDALTPAAPDDEPAFGKFGPGY